MSTETHLPRCAVCRTAHTEEAYELEGPELEAVVAEHGVRNAAWLHRKYGAIPICRSCFDDLGFQLENERPGAPVRITRRK